MQLWVCCVYLVMLVVLLAGARWYGKGEWNEEFLTLKQTKYIQGFLALCIMMHHIAQETCASWQNYPLIPGLEFFVPIGYFFVAMFIFCSGYGLYKSTKAKADYLKGFFGRRILPLILAFYTTGLIFLLARILMKEKMDSWKYFCYITGWMMPNPNGWYVVAMPFFYFVFYLSFRFLKKDWLSISGVLLGTFLYTFLGTWVDHNDYLMRGEWWYNSVHLFWIGILFAKYEKTLVEKLKKHFYLYLILALASTVAWFRISQVTTGTVSYYGEYNRSLTHWMVVRNRWICLFTEAMACASFVFSVIILNLKMRIGNPLLGFMGKITLEFYLIHGLFLEFFAFKFCDIVPSITRIKNVPLLIVVVFVPAVIAALALQKLHIILQKLLTGQYRKKN